MGNTQTEEIPYSEYPRNWYFVKDQNGTRVPVEDGLQYELERADDVPPIKINDHAASILSKLPKFKYEERVFIKHPWKNDTPVGQCNSIDK